MKIKPKETYGEFCKRLIFACKLTQEQFAEKVGIAKSSVWLYETKGATPSFINQKKIDEFSKTVR